MRRMSTNRVLYRSLYEGITQAHGISEREKISAIDSVVLGAGRLVDLGATIKSDFEEYLPDNTIYDNSWHLDASAIRSDWCVVGKDLAMGLASIRLMDGNELKW